MDEERKKIKKAKNIMMIKQNINLSRKKFQGRKWWKISSIRKSWKTRSINRKPLEKLVNKIIRMS